MASHVASPKAVPALKLDPTASVRRANITLTWELRSLSPPNFSWFLTSRAESPHRFPSHAVPENIDKPRPLLRVMFLHLILVMAPPTATSCLLRPWRLGRWLALRLWSSIRHGKICSYTVLPPLHHSSVSTYPSPLAWRSQLSCLYRILIPRYFPVHQPYFGTTASGR